METTTASATTCVNGCELNAEELESPRRDEHGSVWCDECFDDAFTFDCCACDTREHEDNQHRYMVVFNAEDVDMERGVYRIIGKPYCTSALIGAGWLHPKELLRVGDVPNGASSDGSPCGHLCVECSKPFEEAPGARPVNPVREAW